MSTLQHWFIAPLNFEFMQNALIAAIVIGVVCAVLSCFLVLKGWSLMGDAVSHAVLPGIAIAEVLSFAHPIGAFISGLACAVFTGFIREHSRIKEDTVMGIVFSGMFALGILLISSIETDKHLMHIITGNLLGITPAELTQTMVISGIVLLVMALKWKDFLLFTFDTSHARVIGLPTRILHYSLLIMLALTIVASIQAVGVIMVISLLIAPGITGFVLTKRFSRMLIVAVFSAVIASVVGVIISYHLDASTAACIVLAQSCLFLLALVGKNGIRLVSAPPIPDAP